MLVGMREFRNLPDGSRELVYESFADNRRRHSIKPDPKPRAPKVEKPAKVEPGPFQPITEDDWTIVDVSVARGFKLDNPKPNPLTGKVSGYMRFKIPRIKIRIKRTHWLDGVELVVNRSTKGVVSIVDSENRNVQPLAGVMNRDTLQRIFGPSMGDTVAQLVDC